ncbi:histidine kinase [Lysobacter sp. Root494]|uniref:sensor histidine kinase n=1 Tax=Lysobacter sp. Root494 TaxID=1736549 RepID=UPI000A58E952|nr:histidine kinase [Lysobacter sp. Root494]
MTRDDVRFVLLNTLFGVAYAAFNLLFFSIFMRLNVVAWVIAVGLGIGVWLGSSVLRIAAMRGRWIEQGGARFALKLAIGVLLGATATMLLVNVMARAALSLGWVASGELGRSSLGQLFGYWTNIAVVLGMWTALWAGWQALRRYRQGEMARLRAESQRSALELDALRARLNPHFVFNALNNVRALINEEPARAREVVTQLSNILRHALEHSQRESASLGEELAVVDDYLAVESVHYEERLRVHRDIARDALDAQLPPMLLQLLVENAIKHGIARTPGGGELSVSAWRQDGKLAVEVSNPGRMDGNEGGHGVGLAYLRARLAREPGHHFELRQNGPRVLAHLEISQ